MTWINTKVEFEWDGEKYVETDVEGYEYEGEIEHAQRGSRYFIQEQSPRTQSQIAHERVQKDLTSENIPLVTSSTKQTDVQTQGLLAQQAQNEILEKERQQFKKHDAAIGRMRKHITRTKLDWNKKEENLRKDYHNMPWYHQLAFHGTLIPNLTGLFGTERVGDPFRKDGFSGEDNYVNMLMGERPQFTTTGFRDAETYKQDPSSWSDELQAKADKVLNDYYGTGDTDQMIGQLSNYINSQGSALNRNDLLYEE
jgi:hypothetical protein